MARLTADDDVDVGAGFAPERRFGVIRWLATSLVVRLVFVLIVFAAVPFFLYQQLRTADAEKRNLLLESSQREGAIIGAALRARLMREDGIPGDLNEFLSGLIGPDTGVKLLLSPGGESARDFFYVAAAPSVPTSALENERTELIERGILSRLAETCSGNMPIALRIPRPEDQPSREANEPGSGSSTIRNAPTSSEDAPADAVETGVADRSIDRANADAAISDGAGSGNVEILTSITPVRSSQGCWALVTSHSTDSYLETSIGQPYWMTPEVRVAGAVYLSMALLVTAIFVAILRNLRRFGRIARQIQRTDGQKVADSSTEATSFAAQNTVPELHDVAHEFDRLVSRLRDSAESIRRAAEDNAHAFKTPIGIIRQSLEPLRRLAGDQPRAVRSVELVEQAVARLDTLVSLARHADQSSADTVEPDRERLDFSRLLSRMMDGFGVLEHRHKVSFSVKITESLFVLGDEEMLETVVENLVDNAVSFSPEGGQVEIALQRDGGTAVLTVTDSGPGVDPEKLPRIFDRYYSDRPPGGAGKTGEERGAAPGGWPGSQTGSSPSQRSDTSNHFGIGLWIVRRYVEALGGRVSARNVPGRGLRVLVRLEVVA